MLNAPRADAHAAGFSQSVRAAVCGMAPPPQTAEEHLALVKEITGPYPKTIWQGLGNQYIEIYQCVWCFSKLITPICKGAAMPTLPVSVDGRSQLQAHGQKVPCVCNVLEFGLTTDPWAVIE